MKLSLVHPSPCSNEHTAALTVCTRHAHNKGVETGKEDMNFTVCAGEKLVGKSNRGRMGWGVV